MRFANTGRAIDKAQTSENKIARVKYSSRLQVSLTIYRVDENKPVIYCLDSSISCIHTAVCSKTISRPNQTHSVYIWPALRTLETVLHRDPQHKQTQLGGKQLTSISRLPRKLPDLQLAGSRRLDATGLGLSLFVRFVNTRSLPIC